MDRNLALEFVRVTEAAAISAAKWVGRGDKHSADGAAVKSMRDRFNDLDFSGKVVIGEGEMDEAPMLYIGEKLGRGTGIRVDIAVDPLEGTSITAKGLPNAISVLAAGPEGSLLHAPDMYMDKIAVGPEAAGKVDLDWPVEKNVRAVANALGKEIGEVTVVMLDRDRHKEIIDKVRKIGARIRLIGDGDIAGGIAPSMPQAEIDLLLGSGGAPEGVIAAAALKCLGGDMQGRLMFTNEEEKARAKKMGIADLNHKFGMQELAKGDRLMFVATGVTEGTILDGVHFTKTGVETHSVVMRSKSGTIRYIKALHAFGHEIGHKL